MRDSRVVRRRTQSWRPFERTSPLKMPPPTNSRLTLARLILSTLAVGLIWATSLSNVVNAFRGPNPIIQNPTLQTILNQATNLYNETKTLAQQCENCVLDALLMCNRTLHSEMLIRSQQLNQTLQLMQHRLQFFKQRNETCWHKRDSLVGKIKYWQETKFVPHHTIFKTNTTCSRADEKEIFEATGSHAESEKQKAAVYDLARNYSADSQNTVEKLVDQILDRMSYDRDFMYNKTLAHAQLDEVRFKVINNFGTDVSLDLQALHTGQLLACASISETHGSCFNTSSLRDMLSEAFDRVHRSYMKAVDNWREAAARVAHFSNRAHSILSVVRQTFRLVATWINTNLPELGGRGIPAITGLAVPSLELPALQLDIDEVPYIPTPPTFAEMWVFVKPIVDEYEDKVAKVLSDIEGRVGRMKDQLSSLQTGFFEDYNPPQINAVADLNEYTEKSATFRQDSARYLKKIKFEGNIDDIRTDLDNNQSGDAMHRAVNRVREFFEWKLVNFRDPEYEFSWIIRGMSDIRRVLVGFDIAYRAFSTISVLKRFWGRSTLPISPLDVSTDVDSQHRSRPMRGSIQNIAILLTHPATLSSLVLGCGIVNAAIFWNLYYPMLLSYHVGCARIQYGMHESSDITPLAANMYAFTYNVAAAEASKKKLDGLQRYQAKAEEFCAAHSRKTQRASPIQAQLQSAREAHSNAARTVRAIRQCVDLAHIDSDLAAMNQSYATLSRQYHIPELANDAMCDSLPDDANETLIDDCTSLFACDIVCDDLEDEHGHDPSRLRILSIGTACAAEWWFHSQILTFVFALAIYLLLNLFRVLCVGGMTRLLWRKLYAGEFAFIATCDAQGKATYEPSILHRKLKVLTKHFYATGASMIVLACTIQLPWILMLIYAVPDISPK